MMETFNVISTKRFLSSAYCSKMKKKFKKEKASKYFEKTNNAIEKGFSEVMNELKKEERQEEIYSKES